MQHIHAQRLCAGSLATPTEERTRMHEVEILKQLLAREDREVWTCAQLERAVGDDPLDLSDALRNLNAAGVIHLSEDSVTVSRTASWTIHLASIL
jgi:predicted transcriptional regulator